MWRSFGVSDSGPPGSPVFRRRVSSFRFPPQFRPHGLGRIEPQADPFFAALPALPIKTGFWMYYYYYYHYYLLLPTTYDLYLLLLLLLLLVLLLLLLLLRFWELFH